LGIPQAGPSFPTANFNPANPCISQINTQNKGSGTGAPNDKRKKKVMKNTSNKSSKKEKKRGGSLRSRIKINKRGRLTRQEAIMYGLSIIQTVDRGFQLSGVTYTKLQRHCFWEVFYYSRLKELKPFRPFLSMCFMRNPTKKQAQQILVKWANKNFN